MSPFRDLPTTDDLDRLDTLYDMLTTCRPAGSRSDRRFRRTWITDLPGVTADPWRNLHCVIPLPSGDASRVLWSCHTDTVHRDGGRQALQVSARTITLPADTDRNCLGADDSVGVWLCREMILARVPGHYIFHHAEEIGGIGSSSLARHGKDRIAHLQAAIALDRKGTRDIVTHQAGRRTASDVFARSLGRALRPAGRRWRPAHGIYTDTSEYAGIIPECTNLSIGYECAHTRRESVDYWHALRLRRALIAFDETHLTIARTPIDDDDWPDWRDWRVSPGTRPSAIDPIAHEDISWQRADRPWWDRESRAEPEDLDWGLLTEDDRKLLDRLRVM